MSNQYFFNFVPISAISQKKSISYLAKFFALLLCYHISNFFQCLNVMNNYFSVGIDAHIALKFHQARQTHPERFTHRTNNLIYYGYTGFKDLFKRDMSNLLDHISVICDGVDYTEKLKLYGTHSVMFLNIKVCKYIHKYTTTICIYTNAGTDIKN